MAKSKQEETALVGIVIQHSLEQPAWLITKGEALEAGGYQLSLKAQDLTDLNAVQMFSSVEQAQAYVTRYTVNVSAQDGQDKQNKQEG